MEIKGRVQPGVVFPGSRYMEARRLELRRDSQSNVTLAPYSISVTLLLDTASNKQTY